MSRVTIPVLMLNGQHDAIEPVELAQRPMFETLGTPTDQKKWIVYETSHALPGFRNEIIRESLNWFDTYLGRVN